MLIALNYGSLRCSFTPLVLLCASLCQLKVTYQVVWSDLLYTESMKSSIILLSFHSSFLHFTAIINYHCTTFTTQLPITVSMHNNCWVDVPYQSCNVNL